MGELLEYFVGKLKLKKNTSDTEEQMIKTKIRNAISSQCEQYLTDVDSVFTFEVLPKDLPYAIMVIDEDLLKSKYIIVQVGKTLFQATLREVDI